MNLYKINSQHYIDVEDVRSEMGMNDSAFELLIDQFEYGYKSLGMQTCNGLKSMPCKMACQFMQWYMENSFTSSNSLMQFCRDLKPYCKKIPKRQLSRSMRIEIAYRQEYKCRVCGLFPIPPNFEVDHVIELQDGGADVSENLQALCPACHAEKTRLNRLRKNELFRQQTQAKYDTFIPRASGEQVFSKYFSKNTL
jgi:5-methylcytosine-specific restriction endonuclease McrA